MYKLPGLYSYFHHNKNILPALTRVQFYRRLRRALSVSSSWPYFFHSLSFMSGDLCAKLTQDWLVLRCLFFNLSLSYLQLHILVFFSLNNILFKMELSVNVLILHTNTYLQIISGHFSCVKSFKWLELLN